MKETNMALKLMFFA